MHFSLNPYLKSYGTHYLDDKDINAVIDVLKSNYLTCGKKVTEFEEKLAAAVNAKFAVACSNGTTALHLASISAGIKPGDYVIVPTITFLATANAARYCGAEVIFSDVNPENGLIEVHHIQEAIKRSPNKPVAIYPVDFAGQPVNLPAIKKLCSNLDIKIIEDACHALGSNFIADNKEQKVGNGLYADFTTFSFHPVKNITTGEGGAITTNDPAMYDKLKMLSSHGMLKSKQLFTNIDLAFDRSLNPNPWYYEMQELGFNYRITDIQAALGISQLEKLNHFNIERKKLKLIYDQLLIPYAEFIRPIKQSSEANSCWHLYPILIDFEKLQIERSVLMKELFDRGIGSQVHYIPVHLQPYYSKRIEAVELQGAMAYYNKTLSLPLHVRLNEEDIGYVINNLLELLKLK